MTTSCSIPASSTACRFIFGLILAVSTTPGALALQGDQPPPPAVPADASPQELADQVEELDKKVAHLSNKVESELGAASTRFETMLGATERAFNMIFLFGVVGGAMGSLLGGLLLFASWRRDQQRHKDYERERSFFEERSRQQESRLESTHELQLRLAGESAAREAKYADHMLTNQIDSIQKLGGVIDLVQKTFDMQLKTAQEQKDYIKDLATTRQIVKSFSSHYKDQYSRVCDLILTFKDHSRMDWTRLTPAEINLSNRARTVFDTIPRFVIQDELQEDERTLAQVYQLLGASAFYANDIDAASRYLTEATRIYARTEKRPEELYPRAFAKHFQGLIAKNWRAKDTPQESNLREAEKHLSEAVRLLAEKEGEFLTPLTLAEVLSYIESERGPARDLIDRCIKGIEDLATSAEGLNANQQFLLGRAHLLRGNLDYMDKQLKKAIKSYRNAESQPGVRHYALLSTAHSSTSRTRKKLFQAGLQALEDSEALKKRENTVRATALVWAVIAAHEVGDALKEERYLANLSAMEAEVRLVGGLEPLFFSPITKNLVSFRKLRQSVDQHIARGHRGAGQG